jgi:hypothetical protein
MLSSLHAAADVQHSRGRVKEERKKKFDETQRTELARVKSLVDAAKDEKAKKGPLLYPPN